MEVRKGEEKKVGKDSIRWTECRENTAGCIIRGLGFHFHAQFLLCTPVEGMGHLDNSSQGRQRCLLMIAVEQTISTSVVYNMVTILSCP
jgi:hypothetical protein